VNRRFPPDASLLGDELRAVRDLVADDLVDEAGLLDLMGRLDDLGLEDPPRIDLSGEPNGSTEIPRIRPILVALAARAAGAPEVDGQIQVVAELLHLALGAHDLALGRPRSLRRRVARKVIRRSVSWVAGNHLTLRALELSRHGRPEVLEELVETLRAFADAQALASALVGSVPDDDDWLEHADVHVGALFSFCCRVGGVVAGAPVGQLSALGRFGRHMGRLWHVAEDVAELEHGDAVRHVIHRAATGRPALPIVHLLERDPAFVDDWLSLAAEPDRLVATRVVQALHEGGLHACREVMLQESWRARRALGALPASRYRRSMEALASGVAKSGFRKRTT
jgi:geranylgeranyl pyrophosphate synthase